MEILNLGGNADENDQTAPKKKTNKNFKLALGIGSLAVMVGLGSTLAANISLNGGGAVEFGQGVAQTISCQQDLTSTPTPNNDRSVIVTPISEFQNTGNGTFVLSQIQLSGLDIHRVGYDYQNDEVISDTTGHTGQYKDSSGNWQNTCDGKWLIIKAYTDSDGVASAASGYREAGSGYYRTSSGTAADPLALVYYNGSTVNGDTTNRAEVDAYGCAVNSGIAIQLHYDGSFNTTALSAYCGFNNDLISITNQSYGTDSGGFTLNLINSDSGTRQSNYYRFLQADASWIDKITVESADSAPSDSNTGQSFD